MLNSLLKRKNTEVFLAVDIGTSFIKLMELDTSGPKPILLAAGMAPTPANAITNNIITAPQKVADAIKTIIEANEMSASKACIAIPGPCAFIKKITMGYSSEKELANLIFFEAANYIPHSVKAVKLDYQVLSADPEGSMDVLLVAVKNEIIESYIAVLSLAGLEPAIADIDYFALENMFELNYPDVKDKTITLIDIGSKFTGINIIQRGQTLFTGDVSVGGRLYTDALYESLSLDPAVAEQVKAGNIPAELDQNLVHETLDRVTEHISSELHRQLGFFWNASGTDQKIEAIFVCGGSAKIPGLLNELSAKTGISCQAVDPFKCVQCGENFDPDFISEISLAMGISVGLATRRFGDKDKVIN